MNVCWLGEADCHEAALVGEKAAVLSRLSAEYHVPAGFCVTVLDLARVKEGEVEAAELQMMVAAAYQALGERWGGEMAGVIVRPSYTSEQGGAGREPHPYLASGVDELPAMVERCFQAARTEHLLTGRPMALASVMVQPMVAADVAVRLCSLNPVNGNRQEIVVEAAWGLPDGIVGCEVGRDSFVLGKGDMVVRAQTIADKRQMVLALPGGPREVKVPHYLRQRVVLDLSQLVEVASLALALEGAMGRPVEVECAYQGKTLYLLSCRVGWPVVGAAGRSARLAQRVMTLLAL
jgi:pyruvate,water dikinase